MKKLLTICIVLLWFSIVSCGPSTQDRAKEVNDVQKKMDSLKSVSNAMEEDIPPPPPPPPSPEADSMFAVENAGAGDGDGAGDGAEIDTTANNDITNVDKTLSNEADYIKGKLQHNIPSQMLIDEVYSVWVTIKQDTNLAEKPPFSGNDSVHSVPLNKLLPIMRIELMDQSTDSEDKNFEIKPRNPFDEQKIKKLEFTTWHFDIKALKKGKHTLKIQLSGCKDKDDCRFIDLQQLDVEIDASFFRPFKLFFLKNWAFLFGVIIIPFAIWTFKNWRKKNGPANNSDDENKDMD